MPTLTLTLPRPHAAQRAVVRDAKRYNVLACGRRWGKSTLGVNLLVEPALQGYPAAWFAPTYKLLIDAWDWTTGILPPVTTSKNATERRIKLITGATIEFWTLEDDDAGRSRKYKRVIVDEAGLPPNLGEIWQAAIRPTLADLRGDAWLNGTPKGRNFFWECYQRGLDPQMPDWQCWQRPTWTNPYISADEVEAMRAEMPERKFQQEIEAAFLDDAGGVFRNVRSGATATAIDRGLPGRSYIVGADWGRSGDYTVFAVLDAGSGQLVKLDRSNRVEYELQRQRLIALCEHFSVTAVIAEENAMGTPIVERLKRDGLPVRPFVTTNASKAEIIDGLALAFERGAISILKDDVLIGELEAYEATRTPSGLIRYSAPEGMHDDTVMALALALHGARHPVYGHGPNPFSNYRGL